MESWLGWARDMGHNVNHLDVYRSRMRFREVITQCLIWCLDSTVYALLLQAMVGGAIFMGGTPRWFRFR